MFFCLLFGKIVSPKAKKFAKLELFVVLKAYKCNTCDKN